MTALTLKEYVDVAVTLGRNRKRLLSLRRVVRSRRRKTAMFDTRRWVWSCHRHVVTTCLDSFRR